VFDAFVALVTLRSGDLKDGNAEVVGSCSGEWGFSLRPVAEHGSYSPARYVIFPRRTKSHEGHNDRLSVLRSWIREVLGGSRRQQDVERW
jgi:hypothetical protein